jgi:hypothetical protein
MASTTEEEGQGGRKPGRGNKKKAKRKRNAAMRSGMSRRNVRDTVELDCFIP